MATQAPPGSHQGKCSRLARLRRCGKRRNDFGFRRTIGPKIPGFEVLLPNNLDRAQHSTVIDSTDDRALNVIGAYTRGLKPERVRPARHGVSLEPKRWNIEAMQNICAIDFKLYGPIEHSVKLVGLLAIGILKRPGPLSARNLDDHRVTGRATGVVVTGPAKIEDCQEQQERHHRPSDFQQRMPLNLLGNGVALATIANYEDDH